MHGTSPGIIQCDALRQFLSSRVVINNQKLQVSMEKIIINVSGIILVIREREIRVQVLLHLQGLIKEKRNKLQDATGTINYKQ